MTEFLEEQLDLTRNRISELEKEICLLQDSVSSLTDHLKDTQRFLIKMAQNQSEMSKRITAWPYIVIPDKEGEM